jgi:Xaa-Pro dipeptidase
MRGYEERLERMRTGMAEQKLDALVLRLPENVLLLSGFWPMIGASVLLFPQDGIPVCIVPHCYQNEAQQSLWEAESVFLRFGVLDAPDPLAAIKNILTSIAKGKNWKRIGYEKDFEAIAPSWQSAEILIPSPRLNGIYNAAFSGCEMVDASAFLQKQRLRKTAFEIEKIRTASIISCIGLDAFESSVDVGISGVELVAIVEQSIMAHGTGLLGASRVRAYAQVATGHDETAIGYRPNEISTRRRLESGDVALLELGVVADGYWADRTRVRIAGNATDEQLRAFETVLLAQEAAIAAIRPGVSGSEADNAARMVIRNAGLGEYFPHITGHGVGFGYHEVFPKLAPGVEEQLQEGMVTSVEPGVYGKSFGGFRIEDDVVVTDDGSDILGPYRKCVI